MVFFKTKEEKEIAARMQKEEAEENLNEAMKQLSATSSELAKKAAEAEIRGDNETLTLTKQSLLYVSNLNNQFTRLKTNFDIINLTNSVNKSVFKVFGVLDRMADSKTGMLDLRKISKAQMKIDKYMKRTRISQGAMSDVIKRANPASKTTFTEAEEASIKPLIEAEKQKILASNSPVAFDLAKAIENEKNKIV